MNKAHLSGQISGQIPNQTGTHLPGPSQSVHDVPVQLQHFNARRTIKPEIINARKFMQNKIYEYLMQRQPQAHEIQPEKIFDIVRRLEDFLFKSSRTKDEFINLETFESRLHSIIKNHCNQQFLKQINSSTIGTMIPTPGISQSRSSNLMITSSMDTCMVSCSRNDPSVSIHGHSLYSSCDGALSNGYQQSPNFPIGSSGNSIGVQRITSQMVPTPGLSSNSNNQSYINLEASSNDSGFSNVETTMVSQVQQPKQQVGGQNSHILLNPGGQMGSGDKSRKQEKSYGFSNGALNGGLGMIGNNLQMVDGPGTSDGYLTATQYGHSSRPLQQQFDQHQRQLIHGEYDMGSSDPFGSGNFYVPVSCVGSMINNTQNLIPENLQAQSKPSSQLITNQSHLHNLQHSPHLRPQFMNLPEKHSALPSKDNLSQSHHQLQFSHQQPAHQFQQKQFVQHIQQQKHQSLLKTDAFDQSSSVNQVKMEHVMERHSDVMQTQESEQFQLSELQNQFQKNYSEECIGDSHMLFLPSNRQNVSPSLSQNLQQTGQFLHPHRSVTKPQNEFSCLSVGAQLKSELQGQWNSPSHDMSLISNEQHVQNEFCPRIIEHDVSQCTNFSSKGSIITQSTSFRPTVDPTSSSGGTCRSEIINRDKEFRDQQRWLLFLRHARRCMAPEGECPAACCTSAQRLWKHVQKCNLSHCLNPRCQPTKGLLHHYKNCRDQVCPVCVPVRVYLQKQHRLHTESALHSSMNAVCKAYSSDETVGRSSLKTSFSVDSLDDVQHFEKRIKTEHSQFRIPESKSSTAPASITEPHILHNVQTQEYPPSDICVPITPSFTEIKAETPVSSGKVRPNDCESEMKSNIGDLCGHNPDDDPVLNKSMSFSNQEIKPEKDVDQEKQGNVTVLAEQATNTKLGKPKIKGVSLIELFTPEQIREHIRGLRQWVGQSKTKAEKNQAMERSMSENCCQLCAVEKLTFEPPPTYCSPCGARIKRNAMYYTLGTGDTCHYFCIPCYNESRGDAIMLDGKSIPKAKLKKRKNDEETEEWWVQCDKCEAWQHQICALFNGRRNDGGEAEYICPNCYIIEVEKGERNPLPQSAVLGAKDLPKTLLSDHMEQRLFRKLKHERQERARLQGKGFDEVPGAEALVVRVVSSVDKKLEVKRRFFDIFQEDNYPTEFLYKSKVVLLFQKIEGVEVCLFGMYVQEFGSECQSPNERRVYLSYLDSVKYFRPEIKAVTGEALRTFVYHEILIAYLEYCKKRGFTSCYIWACPPLKGEDYILYCHPEIQKTPKSDKLREWYLAMLRKAVKENVVVDVTNLYDHFFLSMGECKAKVTAARLPYFDGDYWPGAAEDMIVKLCQEEDGRKLSKKGMMKKTITKRALKAYGHSQSDLSGNASKDLLLMHNLGETISPMKEDFIMVHLQHACTHCCHFLVSGNRWVCQQCQNFQLCDKCYGIDQKLEQKERHHVNQKDIHVLYPVEIKDVPADTKDKDEILESEFFDTRQAFLSLCQGNYYQYDTLRRAKHSSMMMLYHLHNPTAPAFVTTCSMCHLDIESGQGWRCETCPDYDVCSACYMRNGAIGHPHVLTSHPSIAERDAQNKEARQLRVLQLRKMLDLLVHASQCQSPQCHYPNCRKVKGLCRHGYQCRTRLSGGCVLCKKMWYLLQLHARACKESECKVPRCRDLREHMRRLQQQSDSRRRAAVMEMVRQRAAEVAGTAG